jgi:hypothetical protein
MNTVTVCTLIGHRDVNTGLICLGSLVDCHGDAVRIQIHDDGTLTPADRDQLSERLAVSVFVDRQEADKRVKTLLGAYPACLAYRSRNVLGLKLFDVPLFADGEDVAFCDSDILFFRPSHNLFAWPNVETGCLFMQDWQDAYSLRPWHLLRRSRLQMPAKLNSGLFFLRRTLYDLAFIERLLVRNHGAFARLACWLEQTCWAALACRIGGRFWARHQIRAIRSDACLDDDLVAGHFTSTVRCLLSKATTRMRPGSQPEQILTEQMPQLFAHQLLRQQAVRLLRRTFQQAL